MCGEIVSGSLVLVLAFGLDHCQPFLWAAWLAGLPWQDIPIFGRHDGCNGARAIGRLLCHECQDAQSQESEANLEQLTETFVKGDNFATRNSLRKLHDTQYGRQLSQKYQWEWEWLLEAVGCF